ncbi:MAG: hypothetical protein L0H53_03360 [Candidatus Nitrosocosmicus sp.]|nr:hypothetical protein [Candidatus Nitrosocosmicus sp.]
MSDRIYARFSHNILKNLTDETTKKILITLAESKEPLSSQEVINKMIKEKRLLNTSNKYVFEKLKQLNPIYFEFSKHTLLFNLDKFTEDNNGKYVLLTIRKLKRSLGLDWHVQIPKNISDGLIEEWYSFVDYSKKEDRVEVKSITNYSIMRLISKNAIIITDEISGQHITVYWPSIKEDDVNSVGYIERFPQSESKLQFRPIVCKYDSNMHVSLYLRKVAANYKTRFVDIIINNDLKISDSLVNQLYEKHKREKNNQLSIVDAMILDVRTSAFLAEGYGVTEVINKIKIIFYDSRNWKYRLNLKGFLLYVYLEASRIYYDEKPNKNTINVKTQNLEQNKKVLRKFKKLLLEERIQDLCPFLYFHEYFSKAGFNVTKTLFNIVNEMIPQLEYHDKSGMHPHFHFLSHKDLDYYQDLHPQPLSDFTLNVCKRYFFEIEKYFQYLTNNVALMMRLNRIYKKENILEKFCIYGLYMSNILRQMVLNVRDDLIDNYRTWHINYVELCRKLPADYDLPKDFKEKLMTS